MTVEVQASDTVAKVKAKIQAKLGISPEHQQLVYAGKQLQAGRALAEYNIKHQSSLYLFPRLRGGMRIFVVSITGSKIQIHVEASDTIANVKERIRQSNGIPSNWQRLLHGSKELKDDHTLCECNVAGDCTLDLMLRTREKARTDNTKQRVTPHKQMYTSMICK